MKTTQLLIGLTIFLSQYAYAQDFTNAFTTTWKTTTTDKTITIPTKGGSDVTNYDFWINWGDNTSPQRFTRDNPDPSHTYSAASTFTVRITGTFPHFYLNNRGTIKAKLLSVEQWGNIAWESMAGMFQGASNLTLNTTDMPVLSDVTDMAGMFRGASSFNQDIGDWNVSGVTDMSFMFLNANTFNQDIGDWNVSGVTDMSFMFWGASAFNQDIGRWNVSSVTDMKFMLKSSGLSTYHYEELLIAWNELDLRKNVPLGATGKQYRARAQTARESLVSSMHNWTITDGGLKNENDAPTLTAPLPDLFLPQDFSSYEILTDSLFTDADGDPFILSITTRDNTAIEATFANNILTLRKIGLGVDNIIITATDVVGGQTRDTFYVSVYPPFDNTFTTTWKTDAAGEEITIPTRGGSDVTNYDFWIDWGDGTVQNITGDDPNPRHTYAAAGTFTVRITGTFPRFALRNIFGIGAKLLSVEQWGNIAWESMANMFQGAGNLVGNATDTPDLSGVTDMSFMFSNATSFNQDIGDWNVSMVSNMSNMFSSASAFNQDIGDWNVSMVSNMSNMFFIATSFNQNIGDWNVSNVRDMKSMFSGAFAFNQDIGDWNVSNVRDMESIFYRAFAFNQDLSGWNVSSVTNMSSMFYDARSFNQDIGDWNVSSVTNMSSMFYSITSFNGDLGDWNVSSVTNMSSMFRSTAFNQDIGAWKVDSVTSMRNMFANADAFNQDIGNWNVSKVTDMGLMFFNAHAFNQDIGDWNVSSVTAMRSMFRDARAFNQDIGDWNVSKVTGMGLMFSEATAFNQDLSGWNVSGVTSMRSMLDNSGLSTYHYEELLIAWNKLNLQKRVKVRLGATGKQYRARAQTARNSLMSIHNWEITDGGIKENDAPTLTAPLPDLFLPQDFSSYEILTDSLFTDADGDPFILSITTRGNTAIKATLSNDTLTLTEIRLGVDNIIITATDVVGGQTRDTFYVSVYPPFDNTFTTTWKTDAAGEEITIPTLGGIDVTDYNFWIDWGDGTIENATGDNPDPSHIYATADTFTVKITGTFPHFALRNSLGIGAKLLSVEQWGDIAWESMANMFHGASNLVGNATDTPDLSGVTDMSFMFRDATAFDQDIGAWNVSTVTNMSSMFRDATAFDQDIAGWNVSTVTNMSSMFSGATTFNKDIGDWNVSSVVDMRYMFDGAIVFNQDIGEWKVDSVTDMRFMFRYATAFNQDISGWNVSSVTNMRVMFLSATAFNQDIGGWSVDSVTDMNYMFSRATAFDQNIGGWNVSSVTDMRFMFRRATSFNRDISGWNVSIVTNMESMFNGAIVFNQDIGSWNVSSVADMEDMFTEAAAFNQDISRWNVSKVTSMNRMLNGSGLSTYHYEELLIAWNELDLRKNVTLGAAGRQYRVRAQTARNSLMSIHKWTITDGGIKENDAPTLTAPLPDLFLPQDFSSYEILTDSLFTDADGDPFTLSITTRGNTAIKATLSNDTLTLTEIRLGVDNIIITATDVVNGQTRDTFYVSVYPPFDNTFTTTWKTDAAGEEITIPTRGGSGATDYNFWIDWGDDTPPENATGDNPNPTHTYAAADTFTVKITGTFPHFYLSDKVAIKDKLLSVEQWGNIAWESMASMFFGASNLTLNATDTPVLSGVTDMSFMFSGATAFNQDIGAWNVSSVTNMGNMFNGASVFNQDISGWNVSNVTDMRFMFSGATTFNKDIGDWNVSGVGNMNFMFNGATAFDQDIGAWNVSTVTNMSSMFNGATAFDQDIGAWDVSSVRNMRYMFNAATAFDQDIGAWNVSSARTMNSMFNGATAFNKDIENWNVSSVTNMESMFYRATSFNRDISGWNVSIVTNMESMFNGAPSFNQDIGGWNVSTVTNMNSMFTEAAAFNQDISGWNVSLVTNMSNMLDNSSLSTYHYEELLIAWNKLNLQKRVKVRLDATGKKYRTRAQAAHDSLTSMDIHNWEINDGGLKNENDIPVAVGFADLILSQGFLSYKIPINSLFTDADDDPLTLSVTTIGDMTVEAAFLNDMLTFTKRGTGADTIIMIATDVVGAQTTDTFLISIFSFEDGFITTWKIDANESITIPTKGGDKATDYDFYIDWGDDTLPENVAGDDPDPSHTYDTAGTFTVRIIGTFPHFSLSSSATIRAKLLSVEQWGDIAWESMANMFQGATNLTLNTKDDPDLSGVTNMSYMFNGAFVFNKDIGEWDVSMVTDMSYMFNEARTFNQDLGDWNVSMVTNMNSMFFGASAFNQDIGSWSVGSVTNMRFMFYNTPVFNQDIGRWNVSNVKNMISMFFNAPAFNQDIGNWNVSKVTNMGSMFHNATAFNQDIGDWDVSKVTNMRNMLNSSGLSTYHYEELLMGWNKLTLQKGITLDAEGIQYRARAQAAYGSLTSDAIHDWTINDSGLKAGNSTPVAVGFSDLVLSQDFAKHYLLINSLFTDLDGDSLTLSIATGGDMAITTALEEDALTLTKMGTGVDSIIITATDVLGAETKDTFYISVISFEDGFMTTWKTEAVDEDIFIPTLGGSGVTDYDFWIDWGDGSLPENATGDAPDFSHTYTTADTFTVKITGTFPHFYLNNDVSIRAKLLSVEQWGNIAWKSMANMFQGASNLTLNTTDKPDLSSVTDMSEMFANATSFNQDISGWNVSSVTDMEDMLSGSGLSTYHYEELLIAWNKLTLQKRVTLDAAGIQYRARAQTAHGSLTDTTNHHWTINDGA